MLRKNEHFPFLSFSQNQGRNFKKNKLGLFWVDILTAYAVSNIYLDSKEAFSLFWVFFTIIQGSPPLSWLLSGTFSFQIDNWYLPTELAGTFLFGESKVLQLSKGKKTKKFKYSIFHQKNIFVVLGTCFRRGVNMFFEKNEHFPFLSFFQKNSLLVSLLIVLYCQLTRTFSQS